MSDADQLTPFERHRQARREVPDVRHLLSLHMASSRADRLPDDLVRELTIYLRQNPVDTTSTGTVDVSDLVEVEKATAVVASEAEVRYVRGLLRAVVEVIGPTQLQALYEAANEAHTNPAGMTLGELISELEREHGVK